VIAYTPDAGGIWTLLVENFDEDGFKLDWVLKKVHLASLRVLPCDNID
jgi:hypothetical protein